MEKALVIGGGGFVGFAVLRKLLEENIDAVVIGRHRYPEVEQLGVEIRLGDIRDDEFLNKSSKDCDLVFHVAAKAGIWGNRKDYFSINLDGTKNVIKACLKNEIPHLVYTSTPSVVFGSQDLEGADEKTPYGNKFLCHYAESKALAEQAVLSANADSLKTTALRPHLIWGPGDTNLIPRLIERGQKRLLRQVGHGGNLVDISYIDNVAEAHLLAAHNLRESGTAAGKAYFISQGESVNLWSWINDLFARLDIPLVEKKVSYKAAYFAGAVCEGVYKLLGKEQEPLMTRFLAEQLAKSHWFSIEAAKRDLGYIPTISTEEGMLAVVHWLKELRMVSVPA